jgi:hypothetical protein
MTCLTLGGCPEIKSDPILLERLRTPGPPQTAQQEFDQMISFVTGQSGYPEEQVRRHFAMRKPN